MKVNRKKLIVVGVILFLVLITCGVILLISDSIARQNVQNELDKISSTSTSQSQTSESSSSSESSSVSTTTPQPEPTIIRDANPINNYIYMGTYKGEEAIFYTNPSLQEYYLPGAVKMSDPNYGQIEYLNKHQGTNGKYQELTETRRIFEFESRLDIGSKTYVKAQNKLFVSIVVSNDSLGINQLYEVDLITLNKKLLFSNDLAKYPSNYLQNNGVASAGLESDDAKYMLIYIAPCYACDGGGRSVTVVLNKETKAEKVLGYVGNVKFDLANKKVTYQNLEEYLEACSPVGYRCPPEGRTAYRAAGAVLESALP